MIRFPLATSSWDEAEQAALQRVIASDRYSMGAEVAAFEADFARFTGSRYAVMVNSGSSANLAMVAALRPLGDYVAQLGLQRPLADYTRDEILTLVEVVVDAYHDHLVEAAEREATRDAERLHRLEQRPLSPMTRGGPF